MVASPAPVAEVLNNNFDGSLEVIVIVVAAGAGPFNVMFTLFCKPCPKVAENGTMPLEITVAARLLAVAVAKPLGVPTVNVVVPVFTPLATKFGLPVSVPPVKLRLAEDTVPTLVRLLENGTVTVAPPRTC